MNTSYEIYKFLCQLLLLTILLSFYACQNDPDIEPDKNEQKEENEEPEEENEEEDENNNSGSTFTSDELSSFLVFSENPTQISGNLSSAPDGQMKIDVEDTIYVVKGYPLGNRISFLKDPSQDITGFYISVAGASHYFDVPKTIEEDQFVAEGEDDTVSVILLGFDPSAQNGRLAETKETTYPVTTEIKIQPHDKNGTAIDEFTKFITVEDPESGANCNSILEKTWEWNFTFRINNGEIVNIWAPGLGIPINTKGGGCCNGDGKSFTVTDPGCVANINEPNMKWIEVYPNDFYVRPFEILHFYSGDKVLAFQKEIIKNWDLFNTDFCSQNLTYTSKVNDNFARQGEHDFTPGASRIKLSFPDWKGGWRPTGGDIVYTCNTLVIIAGNEGDTFLYVYRLWNGFSLITQTQVIWHD